MRAICSARSMKWLRSSRRDFARRCRRREAPGYSGRICGVPLAVGVVEAETVEAPAVSRVAVALEAPTVLEGLEGLEVLELLEVPEVPEVQPVPGAL